MSTNDKPANDAFAPPGERHEIETGRVFMPRFDASGVLPAVASDAVTGEVVMLAYMNAEALALTIETGIAHYWSRSRARLWIKGETSGNRQRVVEIRTDCDQDAIWLRVEVEGHGASCHLGYRSCFFRRIPCGSPVTHELLLEMTGSEQIFDPSVVYKDNK